MPAQSGRISKEGRGKNRRAIYGKMPTKTIQIRPKLICVANWARSVCNCHAFLSFLFEVAMEMNETKTKEKPGNSLRNRRNAEPTHHSAPPVAVHCRCCEKGPNSKNVISAIAHPQCFSGKDLPPLPANKMPLDQVVFLRMDNVA
jgi:hypothetical protein